MTEVQEHHSRNASRTDFARFFPGSIDEKIIDVDEKVAVDDISVDDLDYKDEALRLVGMERTVQYTEEQYVNVRRKLVCQTHIDLGPHLIAVAPIGLGYSTVM